MEIATKYDVHWMVDLEDGELWESKFTTNNPEHVKNIVAALAAFHSGDPCHCFINGEKAVLEGDWGLLL